MAGPGSPCSEGEREEGREEGREREREKREREGEGGRGREESIWKTSVDVTTCIGALPC